MCTEPKKKTSLAPARKLVWKIEREREGEKKKKIERMIVKLLG